MAIRYHAGLIGSNFEAQDLSGIDLRGADLTGCNFNRATLAGGNFEGCTFTNSSFRGTDLTRANFTKTNMKKCDFSRANLHLADFTDADISGSDMTMSYGKATVFLRTRMWACGLRRVTYKNALFIHTDLRKSDFVGADLLGSRFNGANLQGVRNLDKAIFYWYLSPYGGPPAYEPRQGWIKLDQSVLGGMSFQENAAKGTVDEN